MGRWIAILITLLGVGCRPPSRMGPPTSGPLEIRISLPVQEHVTDFEYFTGRLEGSESVEIRSRVNGYLSKIHPELQPGHFITKDTPLFDIDERPYKAAYDVAAAEVARATALLVRLKSDYARQQPLVRSQITTQEEFDRVASDRNEALAALASAEAALEKTRLEREFTKIKSPIDGIVSREMVTVGNLVRADETLLTTVIKPDPIYVYFDIDENVVLRILDLIRQGKFKSARENKVLIRMKVGSGEAYGHKGFVNFVDNRLDPNTGTMRIRGEFPNPKVSVASTAFTPGMFARVRMAIGPPYPALLVSELAISNNLDQKIVYVLDRENKVQMKAVRLGAEHHGMRVIAAGLEATDRVVVSNLVRVRPEMTVKPSLVSMPRSLRVADTAE